MYDIDSKKAGLEAQDFLGSTEGLKDEDGVVSERKRGIITVRAEPRGAAEDTPSAILSVECQGLATKDVFEKPRPVCLVSQRQRNGHWKERGRTEIVEDSLDPKFLETVTMFYYPDETQDLKFSIFTAEHYIGCFKLTLNDLVKARRSKITDFLCGPDGKTSSNHGMITVSAEVVYPGARDVLQEEGEEEEEEAVDESLLSDAERIKRMQRKLGRVVGKASKFEEDASGLGKLLARGSTCTYKKDGAPNRKAIQDAQ